MLSKKQINLKAWTKQKWKTKSGKKSSDTGERYLPEKAIKVLSSKEYKLTSKLKRKTMKKGKQFSNQPKFIVDKVRNYRNEWKVNTKNNDGRYTKPNLRKKLSSVSVMYFGSLRGPGGQSYYVVHKRISHVY